MKVRGRAMCWAAVVICGCLLAGPPVSAQTARPASPSRTPQAVNLTLEGVPLGEAFQRLGAMVRIDVRIEPGLESQPVSLVIEGQDRRVALVELLRASGVNYVTAGLWRTDGEPIKIIVGNAQNAVALDPPVSADKEAMRLAQASPRPLATPPAASSSVDTSHKEKADTARYSGEVVSAEQQAAIDAGLEATKTAVESIPLGPYANRPSDAAGPAGAVAPKGLPILPFPDSNGKPIPIVAPPKGPGV